MPTKVKSEPPSSTPAKQESNGDRKVEHIMLTFKPGQKKETPPPASGTRVFYESLYKQNPNSFIALKWCVEYGILPLGQCKEAVKLLEKKKIQKKEAEAKRRLKGAKSIVLQQSRENGEGSASKKKQRITKKR